MNPQQFAEYINTHGGIPPVQYPYEGYSYPSTVPQPQPQPQTVPLPIPRVPPKSIPIPKSIGKKKVESTAQRISKRLQKQMEDYNKHPLNLDTNSHLELLGVQIKNLQRVADTSLRRIHENELAEKRRLESQEKAYNELRQAVINDHDKFRKGIETLAKYSLDARKMIKDHNRVIDDFTSLVENYTNDTFEKYLDERCLRKFNEMADKILQETEMSPEEIGDIARSLGLDEESKPSLQTQEEKEEYLLSWDLDDVVKLLQGVEEDDK